METPVIRLAIRFTGRVQGVGFRATARACAALRSVSGWVRNEADGSVRMEIQGEAAEAERAIEELHGRMGSKIAGVERVEIEPVKGETGFVVAR